MKSMKLRYSFETNKFVRLCENEGCERECYPLPINNEECRAAGIADTIKKTNCSPELASLLEYYCGKCHQCSIEEAKRKAEEKIQMAKKAIQDKFDDKQKLYFDVSFQDREKAKSLGLRWNPSIKKWYSTKQNPKNEEILKTWKLALAVKDLEDEPTCPICIERYADMSMPDNKYEHPNVKHYRYHLKCCNHYICAECYEKNDIPDCPLCRKPLPKFKKKNPLGIQEYFPQTKNEAPRKFVQNAFR